MRMQDTKNCQASLDETFNPVIEFEPFEYPKYLKVDASSAIKHHTADAVKLYNKMIEQGVAREQARMIFTSEHIHHVLGDGISLHNWVNSFIAKRDHEDAQWEIKLLAREISRQISEIWPKSHANFVKHGKIPALQED